MSWLDSLWLDSLWIVPFLPLLSAALLIMLALFPIRAWSERQVSLLAVGVMALAFLLTLLASSQFSSAGLVNYSMSLGQWLSVSSFSVTFGFYIDELTLVMMSIITGVGFLIHWLSAAYMTGDTSFRRYFAYLNLFIAAMLVLVMADNLLLLYLGWEGVGLCSFLLIGFWYQDPDNGYAARKAFVVTRVGDTAMAIGLFFLFIHLGTLDIQQTLVNAEQAWGSNSGSNSGEDLATIAALLLLGGAVGKSAQLPLQTWLPDAMAGPTPVSALIHAATMVTAGVYLIARTHPLFELSPLAMSAVATVGALTLFLAGCSALVQTDIKRILAYSTMSQIGYMFYALGVGAWSAGIFHLMTHAFFKALLFLAAGLIIISLHHQQDIFKMGGLRKKMPIAFWSFVIGCSCLAALPMTSGYFSKDAILLQAYQQQGVSLLWILALAGAFLTGVYSFRLVFVVFGGSENREAEEKNTIAWRLPLILLSLLALAGGMMEPNLLAVFGELPGSEAGQEHGALGMALSFPPIAGVLVAYYFWGGGRRPPVPAALAGLRRWWQRGWGFDDVYNALLINPLLRLAHINRRDIVDGFYYILADVSHYLHNSFGLTQNGQLRWYVVATCAGAVFVMALVLL
ncbi:MAG: NADH-quinone oxidoreductase subunit L [Pseudomonadales bacterium]